MVKPIIMVVDDDEGMLENYSRLLARMGYECVAENDGTTALEKLKLVKPDVLLTDLKMPGKNGFDILNSSREACSDIPVILVTAYGSIPTAVEAVKRGAFDFISKPFSSEQLLIVLERAVRQKSLCDENKQLRERLAESRPGELVGNSPALKEILGLINRVSETDANILITGESGTGKELVAKAIHQRSARRSRPFIPIDCAALPENLLESELFGYEKGAFSGAAGSKPGLFESAEGGTLFLDEIGEMPPAMQAKLLRAIQERQVRRLGSTKLISIDVRILSATNRDLKKRAAEGAFRGDLFYRLDVIRLHVPPLRERKGDIPLLTQYFIGKFSQAHGKNVSGMSSDAMNVLEKHAWPGNIRELQNVVERAVVLTQGAQIGMSDLPLDMQALPSDLPLDNLDYKTAKEAWLSRFETVYLSTILKESGGNISLAAKKAGIDRKTVHRLIARYNLPNKD
jgi:DNA-binding NtrC family response regulator